MANKYEIPFGVDATDFFEGIKKMDQGVDTLAKSTETAGKEMQKAFDTSATSSANLDKSLTKTTATAQTLVTEAAALGKGLGDALNGKTTGTGLESKLNNFTTLLTKFSNKAKEKINFNIDTAKLEYFERLLSEGADELKIMAEVSAYAKTQLDALDPNSEEFAALAQQVEIADTFLKELGNTTEIVETKNKSLKGELRQLKADLSAMELAGRGNTEEFKRMSVRAGELEDQIGDVSARVRVLASDTKFLDAGIQAVTGLAGAFTAAQGAAALFGSENENVQKVIQRVTGAMAILQGIQAVATALNKDSALSVLFLSRAQKENAAATNTAALATNRFAGAIKAIAAIAIIGVLVKIADTLGLFGDAEDDATESVDKLNKALEVQRKFVDELNEAVGFRGQLAVEKIKQQTDDKAKIYEAETATRREQLGNLQNSEAEVLKKRGDKEAEFQKYYDKLRSVGIKTVDKSVKDKMDAELKALDEEVAVRSAAVRKKEDEISLSEEQEKTRNAEEARANNKKRATDALQDAKAAEALAKEILAQRIKFTRDLADAELAALKDGADKDRAQVRENFKRQIEDLEGEKSLSVEASAERVKLIAQLRKNETAQIAEIDKKEAADRAALQIQADNLLNELRNESSVKELETIRLNYNAKRAEVVTQYALDLALQARLIRALNQAEADEIKKATDKTINDQIKKDEEKELLLLDVAAGFIDKHAKLEEQKQIAVLEIKIKYAKIALEELLKQGNAEDSIVVLQAKKLITDLTGQLNVAVKENKGKGFDVFELLGLGSLSDDEKQAVVGAVQESLNAITMITDFIVDQYQRQIDKRQEVIDQIEDSIGDLESQLEKEKELRDNGFANNVGLIEAELAAKKKAKEDEIKQQEELQRKQRGIQRAQLALDTVTQTSNLITSATSIFKSLAGIPFIGIPLAIATIGLMTGAFIATKVKAFQLINSGQQYGEGGWIDGKSHAAGGKKYYSPEGGDVVELEEGEHVTKKRQAQKAKGLLDAINKDTLGGMSDEALRALLAPLGVHFDANEGKQALNVSRERDEYKEKVFLLNAGSGGGEMAGIVEDVKYLADRKRKEIDRWEDSKFYYSKDGNTITKIPKGKT